MTTIHKDTVTAHAISATNVTISQHTPSIAQTISDVQAQMPGGPGGAMQSGLPSTGIHPGAETVTSRAGSPGNGGSDPTLDGNASSLDLYAINGGVAALLGHDPMSEQDPSQRQDPTSSSSPSLATVIQDAAANAGLVIGTGSTGSSSGSSGSGGSPKQPDGPPPSHSSTEETMFGADTSSAGTSIAPVTYNDEGVHAADGGKAQKDFGGGILGKAAQGIVSPPGPTHDQMQYAMDQIKSDSNGTPNNNSNGTSNNNSNGNNAGNSSGSTPDKPVNGITTFHNDKDGSTTVTDLNNHTVTTLYNDGSSDTWKCDDTGKKLGDPEHSDPNKSPSIPDEDHQGAVNLPFSNLVHDALKSEHQPSHENDNKNVVDSDIPGTVSSSDLTGGANVKDRLLSDNGTTLDGPGGGPVFGTPGPNNNHATPDFGGPEDNTTTSATGPTVRTQPAMKTNVPGSQSGHEQGGGDHKGDHDSASVSLTPISSAVETAVKHADLNLLDSSNSHKTAQSMDGVHTGSDITSILGGNPDAGAGHDNGAFADLIRLAQHPVHSGLAALAPAATHDAIASLQLSALGDVASHLPSVHHVDDVHAASSVTLATAAHDDHAHLTVPVFDHGHAH
jgi:hypothetical protein